MLGYDFAHATTGGFSPLMATVLFNGGGKFAPGILYPIFAVFSMTGVTLMQFSNVDQSSSGIEIGQRGANDDLELFPTEEAEGEQKEIRPIT